MNQYKTQSRAEQSGAAALASSDFVNLIISSGQALGVQKLNSVLEAPELIPKV